MKDYEIIEHPSDIGIIAYGKSLKELFVNSAYAMFDIIADLEGLKKTVSMPIKAAGANREQLLINWLDELLYTFYTKGIIFCEFNIKSLTATEIEAEAWGRHVSDNKNRLKTEIKAATFPELKIKEADGTYSVQVIFDV